MQTKIAFRRELNALVLGFFLSFPGAHAHPPSSSSATAIRGWGSLDEGGVFAQRQLLRCSSREPAKPAPYRDMQDEFKAASGVQNLGPGDPWLPVVENSRLFAQRAHSARCALKYCPRCQFSTNEKTMLTPAVARQLGPTPMISLIRILSTIQNVQMKFKTETASHSKSSQAIANTPISIPTKNWDDKTTVPKLHQVLFDGGGGGRCDHHGSEVHIV